MEVEGSRGAGIDLGLSGVAVVVPPLLFAGLEWRYEAQLFEVVLVDALLLMGSLVAGKSVHAWHVGPPKGGRMWRHWERAVFKWTAAFLLILLSIRRASAV